MMKANHNNMIPFLLKGELTKIIDKLAREIERDYVDKELILICPLKGSIFFLSDLIRQINLPLIKIDFVLLNSIGDNGTINLVKDIHTDITNKHVLIVEEVIDAGKKVNFLYQRLSVANPLSLKTLALLDKPARRVVPLKPDYVGLTIEDRFLIGYGMDMEELCRNYSHIYTFSS